ncbi:prolyl oligopeptidase family serine peptidase [Haliangium sp.]|uniref:alpha/beta hydrolase family protein n=1 Tax=Haliangium sp. TaxID=2663208 RepID=UPI003D0DDF9E
MSRHRFVLASDIAALVAAVGFLIAAPARADDTAPTYRTPPPVLADLVDRPPTPSVSVDPTGRTMLILERASLPPIDELARPELRLAGMRIDPDTHGPSREQPLTRIAIKPLAGTERPVTGLPEDARIGWPMWAPDGDRFAFTVTGDDGIALYYAEVADGRARQLTPYRLNATLGGPCDWRSTSRSLFCKLVPRDLGAPPEPPKVPPGPVIQYSAGAKAPARTYQDLLKSPHDEALFEHYFTSEVALVSLSGRHLPLGIRGILGRVSPSPDGRRLLVDTVHRPFSYQERWSRFPRRIEVYTTAGERLATVAELALAEDVPIAFGSVRTGRRVVGWRADAPASLYLVEAADGGDIKAEAAVRDRVSLLDAPYTGTPTTLVELPQRYGGVRWGRADVAVVYDWLWQTRNQRTLLVDPSRPGQAPRVLFDRSWEDRYTDPGDLVTRVTPQGTSVLAISDAGELILFGDGASPQGNRPFVDALALADGKLTRLWRSEAPWYERPVRLLGFGGEGAARGGTTVVVSRESRTVSPNYYVRTLGADADVLVQLTDFPHPHPELTGMSKELIHYRRADGVELTATLYLPPGYDPGRDGPLPALLWAYPTEFKNADVAGQVTDSPHRFVRVGWWSPLVWLLRGYAVLDDPSMPIVGEGDTEPNDTYVTQLVASARAAVDELVRRGVGDRDRMAIGGHSYGAFMAANLLAHSDLFRAGVARSGAYNRTLTPFGFQSEERTLWQAPEIYIRMSPFMNAHRIDEPLLLIHGEADNNSGTFPLQSRRLYQAIKGLGGVARLVMLPHESHGYRARESIMHMLWETDRWLDTHVKQAPPRPAREAPRRARRRGRRSR